MGGDGVPKTLELRSFVPRYRLLYEHPHASMAKRIANQEADLSSLSFFWPLDRSRQNALASDSNSSNVHDGMIRLTVS